MQRKKKYEQDPLKELRSQIRQLIYGKYGTVEKFCFEEGFEKSTMSRFLNPKSGRTEYRISTLSSLAVKLGKQLVIRLQ